MVINVFKNKKLWKNLKKHNLYLIEISREYTYDTVVTGDPKSASYWFNPKKAKYVPVGRSYPYPHPASRRRQYVLCLYLSYYLPLFLLNELYSSNRHIGIEDLGAGDAKFFYYIDKLGFDNFHFIENFSQLPKPLLDDVVKKDNIKYTLNDVFNFSPVVVLNNGCYHIDPNLACRWTNSIELACCYTHELFDNNNFYRELRKKGYCFLCRDVDNLALAFCREDKYKKFKNDLLRYRA